MSKFFPNTVARIAKNRGFTIIETLLVVAIISILATIILSSTTDLSKGEKKLLAESDMKIYASQLFPSVTGDTRIVCAMTQNSGIARCAMSIKISEEMYQLLEAECRVTGDAHGCGPTRRTQ